MTKKSKIILVMLSIAIICALICALVYFFLNKKRNNIIKTYGNIEIRQVDLSFQVSGIINNVFVEEGDYVKEGQLLATLDDRDYVANYDRAQELVNQTMAQKNEDLSKYKRNYPLCSDDTISKQECETLLNTKDLSLAKYNEALANKNYQKNQLDYTKMFAPQDGIITTRVQEKGARVDANKIVYVMSLTDPIWVRTYINESDLGNIKYGKKAKVLTDTIDPKTGKNKEYEGYIGYISPVSEFTPKTVQTEDLRVDLVYRIRVYIERNENENYEFLRQGMPVSVVIDLDEDDSKENG